MGPRKPLHCCDSKLYEDYYLQQSGTGLPVFYGARAQRGHGLGSILSGLFRSAMPLIKKGAAAVGRQALKTGAKIAGDVADGRSFKTSVRHRLVEGGQTLLDGAKRPIKRKARPNSTRSKRARKQHTSDIFD